MTVEKNPVLLPALSCFKWRTLEEIKQKYNKVIKYFDQNSSASISSARNMRFYGN